MRLCEESSAANRVLGLWPDGKFIDVYTCDLILLGCIVSSMASPMSLENDFHVIIVGAGLAGLSAALSIKLANTSHRVTIFESAKELREVGVSWITHLAETSGRWHLTHTLAGGHPAYSQWRTSP